ncbi:MAG: FHA domain-containing protein [Bryobacterales bacterium]|nr:FHA domain-containing protein [Bryobacterales bacterium]
MSIAYLQYGGDQKFHLESGRICQIGRSLSNEVVVQDAEVSRHHATVEVRGNEYILSDAGSRNGTSLNGVRISGPVRLKHEDRIEIGNTTVTFRRPDGGLGLGVFGEEATIAATYAPASKLSFVLSMAGFDSLAQNADAARLESALQACRNQLAQALDRHSIRDVRYAGDLVICSIQEESGVVVRDPLERALRAVSDLAIALEQLPAHAGVMGRIQVAGALWLQDSHGAEDPALCMTNALALASEAARDGGASFLLNRESSSRVRGWSAASEKLLQESSGSAPRFPGATALQLFQLPQVLPL